MKKSGFTMTMENFVGLCVLVGLFLTFYSVSAQAYGALRQPDEDQKALKSFNNLAALANSLEDNTEIDSPLYLADDNYLLGFNKDSNLIVVDGKNVDKENKYECKAETCLCFFNGDYTGKQKKCILLKNVQFVKFEGDSGFNIGDAQAGGDEFLALDGSKSVESIIAEEPYKSEAETHFSTRIFRISKESDTISVSIIG
jgi:hypothetical protein